jgi:hypothetical protein
MAIENSQAVAFHESEDVHTSGRKRRRSDNYEMALSRGNWGFPGHSPGPTPARDPRSGSDFDQALPTPALAAQLAEDHVAPFLARHIPDQYAPMGLRPDQPVDPSNRANSRYCYRHRPDLKCRRQADEPVMEQLQQVCSLRKGSYDYGAWMIDLFLLHRNSKRYPRGINRESPTSGPCSPRPRPSIATSCFEASSPSAASPSCP